MARKKWQGKFRRIFKKKSKSPAGKETEHRFLEDNDNSHIEEPSPMPPNSAAEGVNQFDITQTNAHHLSDSRGVHLPPEACDELESGGMDSDLDRPFLPKIKRHSGSPRNKMVQFRTLRSETEVEALRSETEVEAQKFMLYQAKQYQMMLLVVLMIFTNSMSFLTFNEMNSNCYEILYEVDGTEMSRDLMIMFMLMYPFGSLVTNLISFAKGTQWSLRIGSFMTLFGYVLRCISLHAQPHSYHKYTCVFVGQILLGFSQPMLLNPIMKISNNWFVPVERDWMANLMYLSHPFGIVGGIVLSLHAQGDACGSGPGFGVMYYIQTGAATVGWLSSFIFEESPPNPPSISNKVMVQSRKAHADENHGNMNSVICNEFRRLLENGDFRFLAVAFVFLHILIYDLIIQTTKRQMDAEYGYTARKMISCANTFVFSGLLGSFFFGLATTFLRYHGPRKVGFFVLIMAVLFYNFWLTNKSTENYPQIGYFVCGLIGIPLIPLTLTTGTEVTYDVPEEFFTGLLFSLGNIGILLKMLLCDSLNCIGLAEKIVSSSFAVLGCLFACCASGLYKRAKTEKIKMGEPLTGKG